MSILEGCGAWDGSGKGWGFEELGPPVKVMRCIVGWGVWHERAIVEKGKHGLQVGEVCSSCWYNLGGME